MEGVGEHDPWLSVAEAVAGGEAAAGRIPRSRKLVEAGDKKSTQAKRTQAKRTQASLSKKDLVDESAIYM